MAPFVGAGVVDMSALARHVLQFGFGVKSPEAFLAQPQAPGAVGPGGQPMQGPPPAEGLPAGLDPAAMMEGAPPTGGMPQPSGIPPQVLSMLQNQGAGLPNTM